MAVIGNALATISIIDVAYAFPLRIHCLIGGRDVSSHLMITDPRAMFDWRSTLACIDTPEDVEMDGLG
jgi:hypothetical protein